MKNAKLIKWAIALLFVFAAVLFLNKLDNWRYSLTPEQRVILEKKLDKAHTYKQVLALYCNGISEINLSPNRKCTDLTASDPDQFKRQLILDKLVKLARTFHEWYLIYCYVPDDSIEKKLAYSMMFKTAHLFNEWLYLSFDADQRTRDLVRGEMVKTAIDFFDWDFVYIIIPEEKSHALEKMRGLAKKQSHWEELCRIEDAGSAQSTLACKNAGIKK